MYFKEKMTYFFLKLIFYHFQKVLNLLY